MQGPVRGIAALGPSCPPMSSGAEHWVRLLQSLSCLTAYRPFSAVEESLKGIVQDKSDMGAEVHALATTTSGSLAALACSGEDSCLACYTAVQPT